LPFALDLPLQRIALIGKPDAPRIGELLPRIYHHLTARGLTVTLDSDCATLLPAPLPSLPLDRLGRSADLAVVVGGDGTLLSAARAMAERRVPLVGINLGRLGFLVDISPEECLDRLDQILAGHYRCEERHLLRARILCQGEVIHERTAVNDVVVRSSNATRMIEIVTHIDGTFFNAQRSDGLIVSTPTGSTAYALSGGGPILHPTLKAIVLVPINPHTLSNRPVVIAAHSAVEITFRPSKQFQAQMACDSVAIPDVKVTDTIRIVTDPQPFRMLHPADHDFYQILRAKLNWSSGYPTETPC